MSLLGIGKGLLRIFYGVHKLAPTKPNRVSIISRQSNTASVDIRMLEAALRAEGDLDVRVLCRTLDDGVLNRIRYACHMVGRQMHAIATSKVVVLDSYCIAVSTMRHKEDLRVIQMWHAMGAFKKFGRSVLDRKEGTRRELADEMEMHHGYDVLLASSEMSRTHFAEAFGYPEDKFVILPLPRTDLLQDAAWMENRKEKILAAIPALQGKKVALYAPTFRKSTDLKTQVDGMRDLIDAFNNSAAAKEAAEWVLLLSPHPLMGPMPAPTGAITAPQFTTLELLAVCDHFITDYSAAVYEAVLADKPVSLYTYDLDTYVDDRGFYLDFSTDMPAHPCPDAEGIVREVLAHSAAVAAGEHTEAMEKQQTFRELSITMPAEGTCTENLVQLIRRELQAGD